MVEQRCEQSKVMLRESFVGITRVSSSLPQYFTRAMLIGEIAFMPREVMSDDLSCGS